MAYTMLFCVDEEAKALAPKILSSFSDDWAQCFRYYLAEKKEGPAPGESFRDSLPEGESFETDFINATLEECGSWVLQQQEHNNRMDQDVLAILDKRSAKDETVVLGFYLRDVVAEFLRPDQKANQWYSYRVPYQKVPKICSHLPYGFEVESYGVYLHRKEELTDEQGIFDLDKAMELIDNGEGVVSLPDEE
ncbi:hypothetical protein BX600DRAFT_2737 [Xylariales sp. PMI_506]|nr:hypothetical protein BX600DRAFT_2737 [Xylariales sp. PMI_506]